MYIVYRRKIKILSVICLRNDASGFRDVNIDPWGKTDFTFTGSCRRYFEIENSFLTPIKGDAYAIVFHIRKRIL
jgi:hypothetical protein